MQLVTSPQTAIEESVKNSIQIIDPAKKERTTYQEVIEKWAVPPSKLGDVLALAGDNADNVPGKNSNMIYVFLYFVGLNCLI